MFTRQEMCVRNNNEARSCNHCYSVKAVSITNSESEFLTLGIQHVQPVWLYNIVPHYLVKGTNDKSY
jgi:hypothetical protein